MLMLFQLKEKKAIPEPGKVAPLLTILLKVILYITMCSGKTLYSVQFINRPTHNNLWRGIRMIEPRIHAPAVKYTLQVKGASVIHTVVDPSSSLYSFYSLLQTTLQTALQTALQGARQNALENP